MYLLCTPHGWRRWTHYWSRMTVGELCTPQVGGPGDTAGCAGQCDCSAHHIAPCVCRTRHQGGGWRNIEVVCEEQEILLKYSHVKKHEEAGRQFYDEDPEVQSLVWRSCRAFGEFGRNPDSLVIEIYKTMSQNAITAQNNTANFRCLDIYELDRAVVTCLEAINGWP